MEKKKQLACPLSQAKNEYKCSLMGKRMNMNLCQTPQQSLLLLQHSCYSLKTHYSYVISLPPALSLPTGDTAVVAEQQNEVEQVLFFFVTASSVPWCTQ